MNNLKDFFLDFRDDTLDFIDDHRKGLIISSFILILLLIGIMIMFIVFMPVKITISNADKETGNIIGTKAKVLEYTATAKKYNDPINANFKWEVSGGYVSVNEQGVAVWELPTDEGTYSITASTEDATATKYVTIIGNELSGLYKNSNAKILCQDTDGDGLTDLYEGSNSRTSQTEKDTDGDGLFDGDEIIMNLDPLKADTKGDGVKDGERKLEYTFKNNGVTLSMAGKGNFTRTSVDKYTTETLENVSSVLDGVYAIYTDAQLEDAKVTISYDKEKVASKGLAENSLAVYALNEDENTFSKIKTDINTSDSTLTFTTSEFKKYFIADSSKLTSNLSTELVFIIDNSGSMYSKDEYASSEENDPEFKRVDVVNDLIDKLKGNYRFGAGKFTFDYTELSKLTSDKDTVKSRVSTIKTSPENFSGTYIGAGLKGGISQFSDGEEKNRRYIVLLSDGKDTNNEGYDSKLLEEQIALAKEKGIKVYTVGLGNTIDEKTLKNISEETDGKYYFAATADDLEDTFDLISAELNYNLYDSDNDKVDDSVIISDSGFLVGRDGFSFSNFSNTQVESGYGYGMVLYSKLFYEDNLPGNLGAKKITTSDGTVVEAPAVDSRGINVEGNSLRTYIPKSLSILSTFPDNFWSSAATNGILTINSTVKAELQSLGFTTYRVGYNAEHAGFKQYESIRFDILPLFDEENNSNTELESDDANMLKVLARLDITKYRDDKFYFYDNNDTAFEKLSSTLAKGEPVMIRINDDYTVLATKLLADAKNMNKYKIEVYDPNYSGTAKYIEIDRNKFSDIAEISKVVTDKYEYKFKYQGIDVGICLSFPNVQENN